MSSDLPRTGTMIIKELLELTKNMAKDRGNADYLIASVQERQALMDEFDALRKTDPDSTSVTLHPELEKMVKEITYLDRHITAAMKNHYEEARGNLKDNTSHQKILGYVNKAMSSSGSYMDYKK